MYKVNYNFNNIFNTLNITFDDLLENPQSNSKFTLWEYFYRNNIDPIDYLNNSENSENNNNCIGLEGYIAQLFKIFKGDNTICIFEKNRWYANFAII